MAKFRVLTLEELQGLEIEFVEFLVLNGITAADWVKLKDTDTLAAERMLELFSDVVFESILRRARFLEKRGKNYLHVFQCLPEELVLVAMESPNVEDVDFTNPDFVASSMLTPPEALHVYTTSKPYTKERELELYDMLEAGCLITDDKLFKALCLALKG